MSPQIGLIIAMVAPVVLLTFLRVNAVMVFLSLCLGQVLVTFVASDANSMLSWALPNVSPASTSTIQLIALFAPAVLTTVFMLYSVRGHVKLAANVLPAAGVGVLAVLLAVPLCAPGLRYGIQELELWQQLYRSQALIVGFSAIISLVFLWLQRGGKKHEE